MNNPHIRIPVRFTKNDTERVEQDSDEEIIQNVEMVMRYERGERIDDAAFGINDPNFREGGVPLEELHQAIEYGEPRAIDAITRDPGIVTDMVDRITIRNQGS